MKEEDLLKEAREVEKEVGKEIEEKGRSPLWYILAVLLALIVILWIVPSYSVKLDPSPKIILGLEDIQDLIQGELPQEKLTINRKQDYIQFITPNDVSIKRVADKIVSTACDSSRICHAKALYYFVRDNFDYVSDPNAFEYVKTPKESLLSGGAGDCDDSAVALASFMEAIGIDTRLVFIPNHVYIEIYLPDALNKYKQPNGWISLDPTCNNCEFGDIPYADVKARKEILEV